MRWQSPIIAALTQLGETLDQMLESGATGFARGLTCDAADTLAEALARAGRFDTAVQVLAVHSEADDEPGIDRHAHLRDLGRRDEQNTPPEQTIRYELRDQATADYLRDLLA